MSRDGRGRLARLGPLSPDLVAIEATGGFESVTAAALAVVNPGQVRHLGWGR